MPGKRKEKIPEATYRCQFCTRLSTVSKWEKNHDNCPRCGKAYDPMLAQEGDD